MESTFKKEYEKEQLPDGSIKLSYSVSGGGVMFVIYAAILVTGAVNIHKYVLGLDEGTENFGTKFLISLAITAAVLFITPLSKIIKSTVFPRKNIIIKKDGIAFGKHQLAFKDISEVGIGTDSLHLNGGGIIKNSHVYAFSGGQKIYITPPKLTEALANAILSEINEQAA